MENNGVFNQSNSSGLRKLADIKKNKMEAIFDSLAFKYDFANTFMSFGIHHYWRKVAVDRTGLQSGAKVLDLCCGTGMITADLAEKAGPDGKVTGMDLSEKMLAVAEKRLKMRGLADRVNLVQGNANDLPFPGESFDCVTIGYGLRNVIDPKRILMESHRVLKPGGVIVAIESAKPNSPVFRRAYYAYLKYWVPLVGRIICHNQSAYCYLGDSIIDFPSPGEIAELFGKAGFVEVQYINLTLGIIAVFTGKKK
jgi:demethylmenaquinone methyltransferase/2-methoxy-6-polyprenyl-1,4-benzoquinol methylase